MKILILEPHAYGHHGPYLEWMVTGLVDRGFKVTVATLQETVGHPSMNLLNSKAQNDKKKFLQIVAYPNPENIRNIRRGTIAFARREFYYWRLFKEWYKDINGREKYDVVFLPYLDYCLYAIGLLGSPFCNSPWVGLAMRPSFHYRKFGITAPPPSLVKVKRALFFRTLRNRYLLRLLTIDEPLAKYFEAKHRNSNKVSFFSEPADLGDLPAQGMARQKLGLNEARKVILLYGSVTVRKGVVELLQALATPDFPENVDILLAGKVVEPAIRKLLDTPPKLALRDAGRLTVIDRFIEPLEEPTFFAAADIIWLGYKGHYSASGLLVQAAAANRPVLACREGIIGWQTQRHNLGLAINPGNTDEVSAAVKTLLDNIQDDEGKDKWRPATFSEAQDLLAGVLNGRSSNDKQIES